MHVLACVFERHHFPAPKLTHRFAGQVHRRSRAVDQTFTDLTTLPFIDHSGTLGTLGNLAPLTLAANMEISQADELDNDLEYIVDALGLPLAITDADGNTTLFSRNGYGQVTRMTGPDPTGPDEAPVTEYEYDALGNLLEMTLPDDSTREWTYDATWNVPDSYTDERGTLTLYDINATTGLTDEVRIVIGLIDDVSNGETDDIVTSYTYTPAPSSAYDPPAGLVETVTDPLGRVTTFAYNELGLPTSITYADGTADEAEVQFFYDGDLLDYELDELGRRTDYDYDNLGRLIETTLPDPDGAGPLTRPTIEYVYCSCGNLKKVIDPLGRETEYFYDDRNRVIRVTDALAGETDYAYDLAGNLLSLTDPVENVTEWAYDLLGRQISETITLASTPVERLFGYDAAGNLIQKTDRLGRVTTYVHDDLYRLTSELWWEGTLPTTTVAGDTEGEYTNEVQTVGFTDDPAFTSGTFTLTYSGQTTSALAYNATAATVRAALEALSNLAPGDVAVVKTANAAGDQQWQVTFQGTLRGVNVSQLTVDASVVYNGVGAPDEIETTATQGETIHEVQIVTVSNATGGTFTLALAGERTAQLDEAATAGEVEAALEALDGLDAVAVSGSAGGPWTITFQGSQAGLDLPLLVANGQLLTNSSLIRTLSFAYNGAGELSSASDPSATYTYQYDMLGRVTDYSQTIDGLTPLVNFAKEYDSLNNLLALATTIDTDLDYQNEYLYDNLSRLTRLTQSDQAANAVAEKRIDFGYNSLGQFTQIKRYADLAATEYVGSTHYLYDGMGRLTQLTHAQSLTAPIGHFGADALAGYAYSYDPASRITAIYSLLDGLSEYGYDDTNQLTDADHTGQADEGYEYDANGNRINGANSPGEYNRLETDGTYNYAYDAEGNRISRTRISDGYVTEYVWDHRNRLVEVIEKDDEDNVLSTVEQSYDVYNQWVRRSVDADGPGGAAAVDTFFAYDSGQIVLQFDGDEAADLSHRYLWGGNIDHLLTDEAVTSLAAEGDILWTHGDHLNTIRDLATYNSGTNETTVANHRDYASFGSLLSETNSAFELIFGFTGRPFDESTELQNNLNRWYAAINGQWMSEDPVGFGGGDLNLNRYVSNAVTVARDPSGNVAVVDGLIAGAIGAVTGAAIGAGVAAAAGLWNNNFTWGSVAGAATAGAIAGGAVGAALTLDIATGSIVGGIAVGVAAGGAGGFVGSGAGSVVQQRWDRPNEPVDWDQVGHAAERGGAWGAITGGITGGLGPALGGAPIIPPPSAMPQLAISGGAISCSVQGTAVQVSVGQTAAAQIGVLGGAVGGSQGIVNANSTGGVTPNNPPVLTGQIHHPISTRISRALDSHPTLRGHFHPRDPRFTTQATDRAAHNGYWGWHEQLDDEVARWIQNSPTTTTPADFLTWLRWRYSQPDLQARFPNGF
ncbi:MAG: RHS repeat-associated core domain-containing protein [Planctomycetaceae bacterium]|nr:RHS repeat-associated core domain-containing protein [Planctomycetaceae bacterium]